MLHQKIKETMVQSMKDKNEVKLTTLRGLLSAFTNELVATGKKPNEKLDDENVLVVIKKAVKQRRDSVEQFKKGGRNDLVEREKEELAILEEYLPETMSQEDIKKIAEAKKAELGIEDKSKMGMLMGALMKELGDKADGGDVKSVVESLF